MEKNFKNRLFMKLSIILAFFLIVLSVIFLGYAAKTLHSDSANNLNYSAQKTANEIDNLITSMDNLTLNISTNTQVRDYFSMAADADHNNSYYQSNEHVLGVLHSAMISNSVSKFRISLYNQNGDFISAGLAYSQNVAGKLLDSEDYESWYSYKEILGRNGGLLDVTNDFWSTRATSTITLYRNIYHSSDISQSTGIVEIQCPIEYIKEFMSIEAAPYHYSLTNENGKNIYRSDSAYQVNESNAIATTVLLDCGWSLTMSCPKTFVYRLILPITVFIFLIYIAMLGLCLLIMNQTIKKMTRPLSQLTDTIHNVTLAQPDLLNALSDYPDEFVQLNEAFTQMIERLQQYMEDNIKRRAYEMQANMIALQSQINPHFLYNSLAVIKAHSIEGNNNLIESACDYLAQMLRYISVYSEQNVPLASEINHCILYLKMMKIRYEDSFHFTVNISDDMDASSILIPRLCLQPLLENCFQHGFKGVTPPWDIRMQCFWANNICQIEVFDNGTGFVPDEIKKLEDQVHAFLSEPSANIPSLSLGGMGLINTIVRMKLHFHDNFHYRICTSDGSSHSTKIIFEIGGIDK